jgi:hypothetical protein
MQIEKMNQPMRFPYYFIYSASENKFYFCFMTKPEKGLHKIVRIVTFGFSFLAFGLFIYNFSLGFFLFNLECENSSDGIQDSLPGGRKSRRDQGHAEAH